jgi:hypothetical protein
MLALVGYVARQSVFGVLLDERNRMSLSRAQLVGWTLVILGAYAVTSTFLIGAGSFVLPQYSGNIWALLGIAFGSPTLSGLILSQKSQQTPTAAGVAATDADPSTTNIGVLAANVSTNGWSFMDLFTGEELANQNQIDIFRFQQFVITAALMITFVGALLGILWVIPSQPDWAAWAKTTMPQLDQTFLGLLGVSHAGYLVAKAAPKMAAGDHAVAEI